MTWWAEAMPRRSSVARLSAAGGRRMRLGAAARGRFFIAGFASLAAAASFVGMAQAQIAPSRSGSPDIVYLNAEESMKQLADFGRCYGDNQRKQALLLIAMRPGSREEAAAFRKLFKSDSQMCLIGGTTMYSSIDSVRGAIAEGLLRSGEPLPAEYRLAAPTAAEVGGLSDVARCYAASNVEEVRRVLATRPGSRAEHEAVKGVVGGFGACLPPGGRIRADSTLVRFRLAEALLRLGVPFTAPAGS
jgi:hypothetical protein